MPFYRKKPVVIKAIQYTGDNIPELTEFMFGGCNYTWTPTGGFFIHTLEGDMEISKGDFVIRGVKGEFYPCKPDIFEETYEQVTKDL